MEREFQQHPDERKKKNEAGLFQEWLNESPAILQAIDQRHADEFEGVGVGNDLAVIKIAENGLPDDKG